MKYTWLGGWASDLKCWSKQIESLYPHSQHQFIDSHQILKGTLDLKSLLHSLTSKDTLVAWSLGSLILHQLLAKEKITLPTASILSLCPIFNFCGEKGWHPLALKKMCRGLKRDKNKVLTDFYDQMTAPSPLSEEQKEQWMEASLQQNSEDLIQGLEFLEKTKVEINDLTSYKSQIHFVLGNQDPISLETWKGDEKGFPHLLVEGGHLPFIFSPKEVFPLL